MSKVGRPQGINFEFIKTIKLNQNQVDNWDSKRIKAFLDGDFDKNSMINDFKRLYQIMNLYLIGKLSNNQITDLKEVLNEIKHIEEVYHFE